MPEKTTKRKCRSRRPSRFEVQFKVEAKSESLVIAMMMKLANSQKFNIEDVRAERVVPYKAKSRAQRLTEALGLIEDAKSEVENLKGELQGWRDNLPENLQDGNKASQLEAAITQLEEIESNLDSLDVDANSVEFPGMF